MRSTCPHTAPTVVSILQVYHTSRSCSSCGADHRCSHVEAPSGEVYAYPVEPNGILRVSDSSFVEVALVDRVVRDFILAKTPLFTSAKLAALNGNPLLIPSVRGVSSKVSSKVTQTHTHAHAHAHPRAHTHTHTHTHTQKTGHHPRCVDSTCADVASRCRRIASLLNKCFICFLWRAQSERPPRKGNGGQQL